MAQPSPSNRLDVKFALSYLDCGFEQVCDELLMQGSTLGRTRLFRDRMLDAWRGKLQPYGAPHSQDRERWLTSQERVKLSLRLRAEDPTVRDLYLALLPLPDNRSRTKLLKRILFDALHSAPRTSASDSRPQLDKPHAAFAPLPGAAPVSREQVQPTSSPAPPLAYPQPEAPFPRGPLRHPIRSLPYPHRRPPKSRPSLRQPSP